jgi:hypothetical protein
MLPVRGHDSMVSARRLKIALAAVIAGVAILGSSAGSQAQGGCITKLPLSWSVSSHYAAAWNRTLRISVRTHGATISRLSVSLSTFGGVQLGSGSLKFALTGTASITIKLRYPMQAGKFTLYFYGFPNANPSCGPKHLGTVLHLTGCTGTLPVHFVSAPEGNAADYGSYYSFDVEPIGGRLLRGLAASLSTFDGTLVGKTKIPVLFGQLHVSIPLRAAIAPLPTKYTLDVSGFTPGRPRSCGAVQAPRTLSFH